MPHEELRDALQIGLRVGVLDRRRRQVAPGVAPVHQARPSDVGLLRDQRLGRARPVGRPKREALVGFRGGVDPEAG